MLVQGGYLTLVEVCVCLRQCRGPTTYRPAWAEEVRLG